MNCFGKEDLIKQTCSPTVIDLSSSDSEGVIEEDANSDECIAIIEDDDAESNSCQLSVSTSTSSSSTHSYPEIERTAESKLSPLEATLVILETPPVIPRKSPQIGNTVYGQVKSALYQWNEGVVRSVLQNNFFNSLEFDVEFNIPKIKNNGSEDYRKIYRQLPASLLAYNVVTPFKLPVGCRVIANISNSGRGNEEQYYVGIIAEPIKLNRNKYLIFFDDGSAQYVEHANVRLLCASSPKVWEDVYPDSQEFIENYLRKYPEVPLMAVTKNSSITAEWNGKPWLARVKEVDNSLVFLKFDCTGHTEWVYRGSQRLLMYQTKKIDVTKATQYSLCNNDVFGEIEKYHYPIISSVESCIEYEGKLERINFPSSAFKNYPFDIAHWCTQKCVPRFLYDDHRTVPPMAIPFFIGFQRIVDDSGVYYKGPCGKIFRTSAKLHQYLFLTNSNLGMDLFSYDKEVRCSTKFVPKTLHYKIKDISHGINDVPIQCINSLGMDMPGYFEYTNSRLPQGGVSINYDMDFLTCCDCLDDCQNKSQCSCWQLTFSGCAFARYNSSPSFAIPKGYEYRRLYDFIVSGIYECNPRCRCRSTCLNKVVQNPSRLPMQVFKTANKGWAIRPLCDLPQGTFICTYGGQLLTESKANEDGKRFGDEYLAQIDYIEVTEHAKFGYESNADMSDIESDDDIEESPTPNLSSTNLEKLTIGTNITTHTGHNNLLKSPKKKSTRQLFGIDEQIYVMDAKSVGNIGRYLNHSCDPNVYVQNVFIDSHDIRFPYVAFFASTLIEAGTELTWNYNYTIGSVPGKKLYCHCGTPKCKGRLL